MSSERARPPTKIAAGKFHIGKKLGAGCFGEVYRGYNTVTQEEVAVKFEDFRSQQLEHEADILQALLKPESPQGFAQSFYFGQEGRFQCMVIELLGRSLEDHMQQCRGTFNVKTTTLVAEQCLKRMEYLHSKCIIHRDIKPENFMFGIKNKIHHLYLIDFGLSKHYFHDKHVPIRSSAPTSRNSSKNICNTAGTWNSRRHPTTPCCRNSSKTSEKRRVRWRTIIFSGWKAARTLSDHVAEPRCVTAARVDGCLKKTLPGQF